MELPHSLARFGHQIEPLNLFPAVESRSKASLDMNRKLGYDLSMRLKPIWIHQLKAKSPLSFRLSSCWSFPHWMVVAWIGVCLCFSFKEGIWWVFLQLWTRTLCLVRSLNLKSNRTTKGRAHSSLGFQEWNSDWMRSSRTCTLLFNTVAVSLNLARTCF